MRKKILIIFVLLFTFMCAGQSFGVVVTKKHRDKVSKMMLDEIVKVNGPAKPISKEEQIAQVFYSLVDHTKRKDVQYRLSVVNSKNINAYALPNGTVVFYSGLIDALPKNDLSPLAFIAAHEISHIEKKHADKKIQNALITGLAITLLVRKSDRWVKLAGGVAYGLLRSGYSRDCETEADMCALDLMMKANYDPNGSFVVFNIFKDKRSKHKGLSIFPTHPKPTDRYNNVVAWINKRDDVALNEPDSNNQIQTAQKDTPNTESTGVAVAPPIMDSQPHTPSSSAIRSGENLSNEKNHSNLKLPDVDYTNFSIKQLKKGYYMKSWENKLVADLRERLGKHLQPNPDAMKRARSITYGKYQSRNEPDQLLLVFMLDSYWTYELFLEYLDTEILPKVKDRAADFNIIGVAVKRNMAKKRHVVILLETGK